MLLRGVQRNEGDVELYGALQLRLQLKLPRILVPYSVPCSIPPSELTKLKYHLVSLILFS